MKQQHDGQQLAPVEVGALERGRQKQSAEVAQLREQIGCMKEESAALRSALKQAIAEAVSDVQAMGASFEEHAKAAAPSPVQPTTGPSVGAVPQQTPPRHVQPQAGRDERSRPRAPISAGTDCSRPQTGVNERSQSPPKKPEEKKLTDRIKIFAVIDYTFHLCRDLWTPHRLARDKRNYVKRLLYLCWPKHFIRGWKLWDPSLPIWANGYDHEDGKPNGSREILCMVAIALIRTTVMSLSTTLLRSLQNAVYSSRPLWILAKLLVPAALLTVVGSFMGSGHTFAMERLTIIWRDRITHVIHSHYFRLSSYYHINNLHGHRAIGDPDELLAAEIMTVCTKLTLLISLLTRSFPPIIWFTYRLWREIGMKYALLPHLYQPTIQTSILREIGCRIRLVI